MSFIELNEICKDYGVGSGSTHALRGINLDIEEGSYTAIMGPSGSGKSTLLHILGGMDRASYGSYRFRGEEIGMYSASALEEFRNQNVAFIFQNFALMEQYSVYENVEMPLLARRIRNRKDRILRALNEVGIEELAEKKVTRISGGERQRTALARAIAMDLPILLADEPTGALDRETGDGILNIFDTIHKSGKTIIVITHDLHVAERADRIVRIVNGKVIKEY